ncbi:MAG TPA: glycosyltransferase family 39 protein [Candidatus Hydrogenedentes bacterium]|nr:glycosyltransferase family 39 protein [Candidatus Hydrogenedentota bacterium]
MARNEHSPRRGVRPAVLLLLAVGIALSVRLWGLGDRSLWYDEGATTLLADALASPLDALDWGRTNDPPLLTWLAVLPNRVLGPWLGLDRATRAHDALVHVIPLLFSTAAVALAFACFRRVLGPGAAFGGALLCALSPFQIMYAHEIRPYASMLLIALAAWYCLDRALEGNRPGWWAAYALAGALGMYNHFFAAWVLLTLALTGGWAVLFRWHLLSGWFLANAAAGLLSLPMLLMAARAGRLIASITNVYTIHPDAKQFLITFKTFLAGFTDRREVYWPLLAVSLALFLAGLWSLRRDPRRAGMAFLLVVFPVAGNLLFWQFPRVPYYEHRQFLFAGAVYCGVVALGIAALPRRPLRAVVWAVLLALMGVTVADEHAQRIHPLDTHLMGVRYKPDNRAAARRIADGFQEGDRVLHASHFTLLPLRHYLHGRDIPQQCIYGDPGELEGFLGSLPNPKLWEFFQAMPVPVDEALAGARRVWYVESWWEHTHRPPHVLALRDRILKSGHLLTYAPFDGGLLLLVERASD